MVPLGWMLGSYPCIFGSPVGRQSSAVDSTEDSKRTLPAAPREHQRRALLRYDDFLTCSQR